MSISVARGARLISPRDLTPTMLRLFPIMLERYESLKRPGLSIDIYCRVYDTSLDSECVKNCTLSLLTNRISCRCQADFEIGCRTIGFFFQVSAFLNFRSSRSFCFSFCTDYGLTLLCIFAISEQEI